MIFVSPLEKMFLIVRPSCKTLKSDRCGPQLVKPRSLSILLLLSRASAKDDCSFQPCFSSIDMGGIRSVEYTISWRFWFHTSVYARIRRSISSPKSISCLSQTLICSIDPRKALFRCTNTFLYLLARSPYSCSTWNIPQLMSRRLCFGSSSMMR